MVSFKNDLRDTEIAKIDTQNRRYIFQSIFFAIYVKFRGCIYVYVNFRGVSGEKLVAVSRNRKVWKLPLHSGIGIAPQQPGQATISWPNASNFVDSSSIGQVWRFSEVWDGFLMLQVQMLIKNSPTKKIFNGPLNVWFFFRPPLCCGQRWR